MEGSGGTRLLSLVLVRKKGRCGRVAWAWRRRLRRGCRAVKVTGASVHPGHGRARWAARLLQSQHGLSILAKRVPLNLYGDNCLCICMHLCVGVWYVWAWACVCLCICTFFFHKRTSAFWLMLTCRCSKVFAKDNDYLFLCILVV